MPLGGVPQRVRGRLYYKGEACSIDSTKGSPAGPPSEACMCPSFIHKGGTERFKDFVKHQAAEQQKVMCI